MKFKELYILLSCHGLEDFPVYQTGDEADSLLANWTAMWHPALINSCGKQPSWCRLDEPPENTEDILLLLPLHSIHELQTGFAERVSDEGGLLLKGKTGREEIVSAALEKLEQTPSVDEDLVKDFFALGYCFLQIQLLTRHMRYSSNLDEVFFEKQVVEAAEFACEGAPEKALEKISKCFDILAEERNHFYPVDAYLVDTTLVAETTLGKSLAKQLQTSHPQNFLITGRCIEQLAERPENLAAMKAGIENGSFELVGGLYDEMAFNQMGQESIRRQVVSAAEIARETLGGKFSVFARRRQGLSPSLPKHLERSGFCGAIHVSLDDGRVPDAMQAKTQWEGDGSSTIDALSSTPIEVTKPESFLNLGIKIGEAMDMDQMAIIWFAHWPGETCVWFEDLKRCRKFADALGKFCLFSEFFEGSESSYHNDRFSHDQYRNRYLKESIIRQTPNPLSRNANYWNLNSTLDAVQTCIFLTKSLNSNEKTQINSEQIEAEKNQIDLNYENQSEVCETENKYKEWLGLAAQDFKNAILKQNKTNSETDVESKPKGVLVVNPCSFVRRLNVDVSSLSKLPKIEKPVYAAALVDDKKYAVVDVPQLGFAWISDANGTQNSTLSGPNLAEDGVLRNEFMEVIIDETSGGIRAIHDYKSRQNRVTQRLSLRYGNKETKKWDYCTMVADEVQSTISTQVLGEIISRGILVDHEQNELAKFTQRMRLWRGSRVLQIEVELEIPEDLKLKSDPSNAYFCNRIAWHNEAAAVSRSVEQTLQTANQSNFESSHFVEIESPKQITTLFTNGMNQHLSRGMRMLDTPLVVKGDPKRKFNLGIGIDIKQPMQAAVDQMSPLISMECEGQPNPTHCWLFRLSSRNVIATHWDAIHDDGKVVGFRVRILETMGKSSSVNISAFKPVSRAVEVDYFGVERSKCNVEEGKVLCEISANEFVELEVYW